MKKIKISLNTKEEKLILEALNEKSIIDKVKGVIDNAK